MASILGVVLISTDPLVIKTGPLLSLLIISYLSRRITNLQHKMCKVLQSGVQVEDTWELMWAWMGVDRLRCV